jgi:hypothetical protein
MTLNQRILALDAVLTVMEHPDVPAELRSDCSKMQNRLGGYFDKKYADDPVDTMLKDQLAALKELLKHPQIFGYES